MERFSSYPPELFKLRKPLLNVKQVRVLTLLFVIMPVIGLNICMLCIRPAQTTPSYNVVSGPATSSFAPDVPKS